MSDLPKLIAGAASRMRSVNVSYFPAYPGGQKQFDEDCQILARAWLNKNSADDEDALTGEVLQRFRFTKALNGPTRWYSDWLTLKPASNGAWAAWGSLYDCNKDNCLVVLLTVGDLRRLAVALGYDPIALQFSTPGE